MVLNLLVFTTNRAPGWYMWLPPFTFLRGFYLIQSSFINLPAIQFSNMGIDNEMWTVYILLIAQSIVLFFLALYSFPLFPSFPPPLIILISMQNKLPRASDSKKLGYQPFPLVPNQRHYCLDKIKISKERRKHTYHANSRRANKLHFQRDRHKTGGRQRNERTREFRFEMCGTHQAIRKERKNSVG